MEGCVKYGLPVIPIFRSGSAHVAAGQVNPPTPSSVQVAGRRGTPGARGMVINSLFKSQGGKGAGEQIGYLRAQDTKSLVSCFNTKDS